MRRKRVESSAIRSVGYDARRELLEQADAKRRFFRERILDQYAVARV